MPKPALNPTYGISPQGTQRTIKDVGTILAYGIMPPVAVLFPECRDPFR